MGQSTGISWTDHTANFWWGCQRVSPGCEHCYAEELATTRRKLKVWGPPSTTERLRMKGIWNDVPKWNAAAQRDGVRRRMFVSSMADVFEAHPQVAPWRAEALALIEKCTALDVQLLTKRPENVRAMVPPSWLTSWPSHVWIGTTVEDQRRANERIPHLLNVPARVRFLSCEPLLERVDLDSSIGGARWMGGQRGCAGTHRGDGSPGCPRTLHHHHDDRCGDGISWVIVGGESGHGARLFDVAWARSIVEQCQRAGVPAFVKQMGDNAITRAGDGAGWGPTTRAAIDAIRPGDLRPLVGLSHHGADPSEWPAELRSQEFPQVSP